MTDWIDMTEDEALMLEKLLYEHNGLKILVAQFGSDTEWKPDGENYKILLDECVQKSVELEMTKRFLLEKYFGKDAPGRPYMFDTQQARVRLCPSWKGGPADEEGEPVRENE
jgi:hypothetical protein